MKASAVTALPAEPGPSGLAGLVRQIREELAPFPGRMDAVWRYLLVSALVIVISMTLEIPVMGLSLVIVFFAAQENTTLTWTTCVLSTVGTVFTIGTALLLVKFTMGYAMLRILAGFLLLFGFMYFMRISKLGQLGWIATMGVSYTLTMLDVVGNPEVMTRFLLWVFVATVYPILLTAAVNYLLLPAHPQRLLKDELFRQLDEVDRQLEARATGTAVPMSAERIEPGVRALHRHLTFATLADPEYRRERAVHLMEINTVDRLRMAALQLSRLPAGSLPEQAEGLRRVRSACAGLRQAIESRRPFTVDPDLVDASPATSGADAILLAMGHALHALAQAQNLPGPAAAEAKTGLLADDWLSNPVYGRFALKTTLAGFVCYVLQSVTQWPGIHTAVLTCFIVALPSLGASTRKGILRILGCALGSLATLAITVFVIPRLEGITGLLLLTLPIIAIGAYLAASERTGYLGLQFVFAFSLALFGQFMPNTNIPEIRDRMVGIMIGVTVTTAVYALVWPEREGSDLWSSLARLVRSIAGMTRAGRAGKDEAERMKELGQARRQGWSLLAANRELESMVSLEPGWQYAHDAVTVDLQTWFAQAQETLVSVDWLQILLHHEGPALPEGLLASCERFRTASAERLDQLAACLDQRSPDLDPDALSAPLAAFDRHCALARAAHAPQRIGEIAAAVHAIHERITQLSTHFASTARQAGTR